ncbi:MAG: cation:proton antiporter subunit C [ANME-2 cluster archaeon]|nr:cation:proton antiporter subunit C [ANME-2 cluster archaeon]MBC2700453.1 cation:proton antiporter subunit C [ANME-2 cluster archaeon]MBC2707665.1 cation:proton antiporter subunit C [ANME-2 cluster archaeon]MBC2748515.1 cation:proton antiporter subunit C [ANME-2 cluster archaeon]
MSGIIEIISAEFNYWIYVTLMMIGFYAMIAKKNLVKKVIGANIFQTAIFLFYISLAEVKGGTAPILLHGHDGADVAHEAVNEVIYVNPLPHVLILTAIVVAVSTTAVALALIIKIYQEYGSLEEDVILAYRRQLQPEFSEYARQKQEGEQ